MGKRLLFVTAFIAFCLTASSWVAVHAQDVTCASGEVCIDDFIEVEAEGDIIRLYGDDNTLVRIVFDDTVLYARRVTMSTQDDERWALLEDSVRVERDDTTITSQQAELQFEDEIYHFTHDVYVIETKEQQREIWAENMTYEAKTGAMTADGNVRLVEAKRSFESQQLEYQPENDLAILKGRVVVFEDDATMEVNELVAELSKETFTGSGPGRIVLRDVLDDEDTEQENASEEETAE